MTVDSSWKVTIRFVCSWMILDDHGIRFTIGSAMIKRRESMSHPMKVMVSLRPHSTSILKIESGSGRLIGSNTLYKVLKMMNRYIKTDWPALYTIL